jgi:hypothetical protein
MTEFVRDEQGARGSIAIALAADGSALIVIERPRAFQRRIAQSQPNKVEVIV